jgi:prepilin-type N-terminal cleavage/methylation domain-containing protein
MIKNEKGFTLIELIITILIIGILATAALMAIRTKSMEARDARRFSDMRAINLAMTLSAASEEVLTLPGNTSTAPYICQLTGSSFLDFSLMRDPYLSDEACSNSNLGCLPDSTEPCQYAFVDANTGNAFASAPLYIDPSDYQINFYEEASSRLSFVNENEMLSSRNNDGVSDEDLCSPNNALDDGSTVIQASGVTFGQVNKLRDKEKGNAKDHGWGQTKHLENVWTEYSWAQGKLLNKMRIWSHFANGAEAIKDFQIIASNDRSNWVTLYTGVHPGELQNEFVDYTFNNDIAYKYYRLVISSNYPGDGGDDVGLDEVEMSCQN